MTSPSLANNILNQRNKPGRPLLHDLKIYIIDFSKVFFRNHLLLRDIFKNAKHTPKKCSKFLIAVYQSAD